ncbi:hypothetical protein FHR32_005450 [Streptosporangium album]|uniref:Uncharacterized protein n=1 Tax=Streptosporangium album TaxID=47479 RepID=A0A7W7RZG4_9ACTN|nr:hypothetical protein [Streptosporangium album]
MTGYDVYREAGATDVKAGSPSSASFALTGLAADTSFTYYVVVRKRPADHPALERRPHPDRRRRHREERELERQPGERGVHDVRLRG